MEKELESFPRADLIADPTPLERLPRLSELLGGPEIFVKRDDAIPLAMGGNKVRQLEYYLGDAVSRSADTIVTTGARQSNHLRLTAAACRRLDLDCVLQVEDRVPLDDDDYCGSGNHLLFVLTGARLVPFPRGDDERAADEAMIGLASRLESEGAHPYVIPLGEDHPPLGALGYVRATPEIARQWRSLAGGSPDAVVVASGGGNTHCGLLLGLRALGISADVYGICVRRDAGRQKKRIRGRFSKLASLIGRPDLTADGAVETRDEALGDGYGLVAESTREAIELAATREGLLLDPVYSGKAMAGLIQLVRSGELRRGQNVLFVHTGGTPAVFAYRRQLERGAS